MKDTVLNFADDTPLDWYPVSRELNDVRNEHPDLPAATLVAEFQLSDFRLQLFSSITFPNHPATARCPKTPHATGLRHAALRPGCRSIPAAKFRHSAELNGSTKAALNSPLNDEFRTQRRSRRKWAGARTPSMFAGDNSAGRSILTML
jgi:hypothetical protein